MAELASGAFSQSFTPQRRVLVEHELADLKDLRVTVVPHSLFYWLARPVLWGVSPPYMPGNQVLAVV